MGTEDIVEAIVSRDEDALVGWFETMSDGAFEKWYAGMVTLKRACSRHVRNEHLHRVEGKYECQ